VADSSGTDGVEVEWQFDALDLRPVERWLAAPGPHALTTVAVAAKPSRRLVDRYLDTEDWRIGRAGFVLRTRHRGRGDEVTLKDSHPAAAGGLRRRLEVTEALPAGGVESLGPRGPVGWRIAAVAGRHPLHQVLEVRTHRRPWSLQIAGSEVAEVALDDTVIVVGSGQQPVRLCRVEVEVVPAWLEAVEPLVHDLQHTCGLQPSTLSKFEAGLLALGLHIPGPPDLGSTEVMPESSVGDLAFAVVRRHLGVLLAREPGTRLGEDIEDLHDMRVATRRLRAAIDCFVEVLPARSRALSSELAWLAGVLGKVRDIDVQIDRVEKTGEIHALLMAQRASARQDLLDALDSPRWKRLASALTSMVQHGPLRRSPPGRLPAAVSLPDLVKERHQAAVKAARRARRSGLAADFHRLRIRCKRLRYSLEFSSGVYGNHAEQFIRKLATLQDSLGHIQDAIVARDRLLDLATSTVTPPLSAKTIFAMGALAERYRAESEAHLAQIPDHLALLQGSRWRKLAAYMERRRLEALASLPAPLPVRRPDHSQGSIAAPPVAEHRPDARPTMPDAAGA